MIVIDVLANGVVFLTNQLLFPFPFVPSVVDWVVHPVVFVASQCCVLLPVLLFTHPIFLARRPGGEVTDCQVLLVAGISIGNK